MGEIVLIITLMIIIVSFCIKRECCIYIAMFFYLILPDYCALNLGNNLPTLTAPRCILILLTLLTVLKAKKFNIRHLKNSKVTKYFFIFILGETIVFAAHTNISQHVKEYFGIILENIIFIIMFINMIDTEEKIEKFVKMLVYLAGIVSIFSLIEPFTGINIAEYLDTGANESMLSVQYERLNIKRATFSLGHPICLAVFLGMLLPLIMYYIDKEGKFIYKLIFILAIASIVLTISRGPIAIIFAILLVYFIRMKKSEIKKYLLIISFSIILVILLCLLSNKLYETLSGTLESILKEIGLEVTTSESFGTNTNGAESRLNQWTALPNILDKYPLCGGGSYYIFRNDVIYERASGGTAILESIDCEYLSILINKGIIGFLGNIALYIGILKLLFSKPKNKLLNFLIFSFVGALICYITVCQLTTYKIFWTIIGIIIVEKSILNSKKEG